MLRFRERFLSIYDGLKSIGYDYDMKLHLEFGTRLRDWHKIKTKNPQTMDEVLDYALSFQHALSNGNVFMTGHRPAQHKFAQMIIVPFVGEATTSKMIADLSMRVAIFVARKDICQQFAETKLTSVGRETRKN